MNLVVSLQKSSDTRKVVASGGVHCRALSYCEVELSVRSKPDRDLLSPALPAIHLALLIGRISGKH